MECPYCKTEKNVVKRGIRKNKYTTKQQYYCKKCKKWFIEHDGFEGMTYPKEIIVKVIHLYIEGLSLSKIRDYIYQHEDYLIYDSRILYWVKKYAKLLSEYEGKLKPKIKGRIHTDEVCVKVKGKQHYAINSIDSKTKYNLAGTFTKKRSKEKCREHFKKLKDKIGEQIKERWIAEKDKIPEEKNLITFVSDKFENYKNGFTYYFYRFAMLVFGVPIACKRYGLEYNNNAIERHNEDFKQRSKVMRGFKSFKNAESFIELRRIIYNFVRTHQGIGRTPAEESGLNLSLGKNRLLSLIIFFIFFYYVVCRISFWTILWENAI